MAAVNSLSANRAIDSFSSLCRNTELLGQDGDQRDIIVDQL